jgi:hypothetical protein
LNLNPEVEVWDTAAKNVGQAFQPAGSPDFPPAWGDWKVAPTGRQECLPHASSSALSVANFGIQVELCVVSIGVGRAEFGWPHSLFTASRGLV